MSSEMLNTLFPPEILSQIFGQCDRPTRFCSAMVCRHWSEPALDQLWRRLESIEPLLKLLGAIEMAGPERPNRNGGPQYVLRLDFEDLCEADWQTFQRYATRVRDLVSIEPYSAQHPVITHDTMAQVLLHHPFGPSVLPNLRHFVWRTGYGSVVWAARPFISESLDSITLEYEDDMSITVLQGFLKLVALRVPNLKEISFRADVPNPDSIPFPLPEFPRWLASSASLTRIRLSENCYTSEIMDALSTLPNLATMTTSSDEAEPSNEPIFLLEDHERNGLLRLPSTGFTSLRSFGFARPLSEASKMIEELPPHIRLREVRITDCDFINAETVKELVPTLAGRLRDIRSIFITLTTSDSNYQDVGYHHLDGLNSCHHLRELIVSTPSPIELTREDVERMRQAWPSLEKLCLWTSSEPFGRSSSYILRDLATAFPALTDLGIHLNTEDVPPYDGDIFSASFRHMKFISIGKTWIGDNTLALGSYLGTLCPADVTISSFYDHRLYTYGSSRSDKHEEVWKPVRAAMRVVSLTRQAVERRLPKV